MKEKFVKGAKVFGAKVRKNSPLLLTIGSIVGVGGIIFTTAKSTLKTKSDLDKLQEEQEEVTKKDIAKVVAKDCWPVAIVSGATIGMVISNHKITSDRIRTATVAYEFYKEAYDTYKEKVRQKLGEDGRREMEAEMASDYMRKNYPKYYADPSLIPGEGVIFIESLSGQVFRAYVDDIYKEARRYNEDLRGSDWLPINEWLVAHLGLNAMGFSIGENLGFVEKYEHDGLNIVLTPSDKVFATGETATIITYEDDLVAYDDYMCLNS